MLQALSIISILIGLVGVIISTSMFFLVAWQGINRPINRLMALYLAGTIMWTGSAMLVRLSPVLGYDGIFFVYVNGSSMVVSAVVLFTFSLVYRRLWAEEKYAWLRYISIGLIIESMLLVGLIFGGVIVTDVLVGEQGTVSYDISPLGMVLMGIGLLSFVGTFTILIKDNENFWRERVFWGSVFIAVGVLSLLFDDIVRVFSIPVTTTTISVLIFTRFILEENVFNPLLELNVKLENTNLQLSSATQAARQSEASLRNVVENTSDLIWAVDHHHKLIMMNSTASAFFELLFQHTMKEGDLFFKFMNRDQEDQWRSLYARAFNGRRFSVERRYHFENLTSRFDLEISFNPSFNDEYEIATVSVFARDITRYKETERELTRQALTFDNISDSIILIDLDWLIADCNPATIQILGYSKDELVGRSAEFFYVHETRQILHDEIIEGMNRRGRWEGDIPFRRKNGLEGVSEAVVLPLRDDGGERLATLMVSRDVTDRKRREEQLRQAKEAAEAANRAKSAFLASMSHELRTPLNAIIGYGEMLREDFPEDQEPKISLDLHRIVKSGHHLLNIVNTVLDLSKVEAGKVEIDVESFHFVDLVDDVMSAVYPLAHANGNRLEIDVPKSLPIIHSDMVKLRQVLINLLGNASKFTSDGTVSLTIWTETKNKERQFAIEVADTGIGMSDEAMGTVFNAFVQADGSTTRQYQGTGLGLTITKRYIELLGGTISVTSEVGKGSQFIVRVPEYISGRPIVVSLDNKVETPADTTTVSRRKLNVDGDIVLVIDDDPSVRDTLTRWLFENGYRVYTVPTAQKGLDIIPQIGPQAVILDLILPNTSSWDVLFDLKLNRATEHIRVIFSILLDDLQQGIAFAADGVLLATAQAEALERLFEGVLRPFRHEDQGFHVLLLDDDVRLCEMATTWADQHASIELETADKIPAAFDLLSTTPSFNVLFVNLDMFSENAFRFIEQTRQREKPIGLVFISDREQLTVLGQRFSTKSTMTMVSAGLYERSKWLHLLTDKLLK